MYILEIVKQIKKSAPRHTTYLLIKCEYLLLLQTTSYTRDMHTKCRWKPLKRRKYCNKRTGGRIFSDTLLLCWRGIVDAGSGWRMDGKGAARISCVTEKDNSIVYEGLCRFFGWSLTMLHLIVIQAVDIEILIHCTRRVEFYFVESELSNLTFTSNNKPAMVQIMPCRQPMPHLTWSLVRPSRYQRVNDKSKVSRCNQHSGEGLTRWVALPYRRIISKHGNKVCITSLGPIQNPK